MNKDTNKYAVIIPNRLELILTAIKEIFTKKDFILITFDKKKNGQGEDGGCVEITHNFCLFPSDTETVLNLTTDAYKNKWKHENKMNSMITTANDILEKCNTRNKYFAPVPKQ